MSGKTSLADNAYGMDAVILSPGWNRLVRRPLRDEAIARVAMHGVIDLCP